MPMLLTKREFKLSKSDKPSGVIDPHPIQLIQNPRAVLFKDPSISRHLRWTAVVLLMTQLKDWILGISIIYIQGPKCMFVAHLQMASKFRKEYLIQNNKYFLLANLYSHLVLVSVNCGPCMHQCVQTNKIHTWSVRRAGIHTCFNK